MSKQYQCSVSSFYRILFLQFLTCIYLLILTICTPGKLYFLKRQIDFTPILHVMLHVYIFAEITHLLLFQLNIFC